MAATKYAKIRPITAPNPIPAAFDCTLRSNTPLRTPTTIPLTHEPIRMEAIMGRAAGVNQAVAPSMIPRTAPAAIPITGLFIVSPSMPYYAWGRISLRGAAEKVRDRPGGPSYEEQRQFDHQVGGQEQQQDV